MCVGGVLKDNTIRKVINRSVSWDIYIYIYIYIRISISVYLSSLYFFPSLYLSICLSLDIYIERGSDRHTDRKIKKETIDSKY